MITLDGAGGAGVGGVGGVGGAGAGADAGVKAWLTTTRPNLRLATNAL